MRPRLARAERFVRTVRSECPDWLLILDQDAVTQHVVDVGEHRGGHRHDRLLAAPPALGTTSCGSTVGDAPGSVCIRRSPR
jgi:hypothetical protein